MRHTILTIVIAAAGVFIPSAWLPSADAADARPCVTRSEYKAVKDGWTKTRVQRRFDTAGRLHNDYGDGAHTKWYRGCGQSVDVYVSFSREDGASRVYGKEYWG